MTATLLNCIKSFQLRSSLSRFLVILVLCISMEVSESTLSMSIKNGCCDAYWDCVDSKDQFGKN